MDLQQNEGGVDMSMDEELGELICDRTPYTSMTLPTGWKDQIEWEAQPVHWNFREGSHRVAKSMRIPVTITNVVEKIDKTGAKTYVEEIYRDWLLIGYEGSGGN